MPELLPLALLSPVLVAAALSDMRRMRIPNALSLIALTLFAAAAPFLPLHEVGLRLAAGAFVFLVGFAAFAARIVGGGDVKLLGALMLFIPAGTWTLFGYVFAVSLAAGLVLVIGLRAVLPSTGSQRWGFLAAQGKFPMGISIGMAGLIQPLAVMTLS